MTNIIDISKRPRALDDEAARWFLRLQEDAASEQLFIDWQRWLAEAPEHREAYDRIEDTALRLSKLPRIPPLPTADELEQDAYDGSVPIREWQQQQARLQQEQAAAAIHNRRRRMIVAASLVALSVSLFSIPTLFKREQPIPSTVALTYQTLPGGRELVTLADGSKVTLDADSKLRVQLTRERRNLVLERGEAYFEVAKDRTRPFTVQAGSTAVTAVGTAFNVRRSDDRTVVAVTEGEVKVVGATAIAPNLAAQVAAGEAVSFVDDGRMQTIEAAEAPLATTWLDGQRKYKNEPLRYVLADVDRYTGRRMIIADEATGDLRFTGTLNLENSAAWLRGLSIALPVQITERSDGALVVEAIDRF